MNLFIIYFAHETLAQFIVESLLLIVVGKYKRGLGSPEYIAWIPNIDGMQPAQNF